MIEDNLIEEFKAMAPEEREVKLHKLELLMSVATAKLRRMKSACAKIEKLDGLITYHRNELKTSRKLRAVALHGANIICGLDKGKKFVSKKISDPCPECGRQLVLAGMGGGVKCSSMKCGYWFCF